MYKQQERQSSVSINERCNAHETSNGVSESLKKAIEALKQQSEVTRQQSENMELTLLRQQPRMVEMIERLQRVGHREEAFMLEMRALKKSVFETRAFKKSVFETSVFEKKASEALQQLPENDPRNGMETDENIPIFSFNKGEDEKSKFLFFILMHGLFDELVDWCTRRHSGCWKFLRTFVMDEIVGVDVKKAVFKANIEAERRYLHEHNVCKNPLRIDRADVGTC